MSEATPRPWIWAWRDDEDAPASIFSMAREGHAYAVAMCPRYQKPKQWVADAKLIVEAVNNYDTALTRIRDLEELAGMWREQAKRHDDAASTADEIAMGAAELCIHLECSRVYGACADALLAALSSKDQEKTRRRPWTA